NILSTTVSTAWTTECLPKEKRGNPSFFIFATLYLRLLPLSSVLFEGTVKSKIITSFDLRRQVNANGSSVPSSKPSISAMPSDPLIKERKDEFVRASRQEAVLAISAM